MVPYLTLIFWNVSFKEPNYTNFICLIPILMFHHTYTEFLTFFFLSPEVENQVSVPFPLYFYEF